jgi:hypothetical protein
LQSGNLSAAQKDYATIHQDFQQQGANRPHSHHQHCGGAGGGLGGEEQQQINTALSSLAQALQSGNLSRAQSAFATLQQDLEQIGGFSSSPSGSSTGTSASSSTSSSLSIPA